MFGWAAVLLTKQHSWKMPLWRLAYLFSRWRTTELDLLVMLPLHVVPRVCHLIQPWTAAVTSSDCTHNTAQGQKRQAQPSKHHSDILSRAWWCQQLEAPG